eukprot:UN03073
MLVSWQYFVEVFEIKYSWYILTKYHKNTRKFIFIPRILQENVGIYVGIRFSQSKIIPEILSVFWKYYF